MILRVRARAHDRRSAALDVFAAARFLASADIHEPRLWLATGDRERDPRAPSVADAWARGIAVVPVEGRDARHAAAATATAIGARIVEPARVAADEPADRIDGRRAAARYALGIDADEVVELVLREADPLAIEERLAAFDGRLGSTTAPRRRLILADLAAHGRRLSSPLVSAVVHPLVLVELRLPNPRLIGLARVAADEVIEAA